MLFSSISRASRILRLLDKLKSLSDSEITKLAKVLQWNVRSLGATRRTENELMALAIEACRRTMGIIHFPVQVLAAIHLLNGRIIEMQTGEGKTATAVLPTVVRSMRGLGCHVVTSNDYLAKRDAEVLQPAFGLLGLTVGCIQPEMSDVDKQMAYRCDITYSTAVQLGFDYLRDRLRLEAVGGLSDDTDAQLVKANCFQRGHYFALVDEADSVLIDDANTPLVISGRSDLLPGERERLAWARETAERLVLTQDFQLRPNSKEIWLTEKGCRTVCLSRKPPELHTSSTEDVFRYIEKSLSAIHLFHRDTHYLVHDNCVTIVDEGTGRSLPGRQWQDGLHQAIEAKEGLSPSAPGSVTARVTVQTFFRRYQQIAGMTGTAASAQSEFRKVYKLRLKRIPTNRPCLRHGEPHRVYATLRQKWLAVMEEAARIASIGRAVLIGTCSVNASEDLSLMLSIAGVPHVLLNAKRRVDEALIVSAAGRSGTITIATNMAGRGTDIPLSDDCRQAGGLHVIATEMHSSKRIDRQLVGRAARQGDPGSYRFMLSLEDELLRVLPSNTVPSWLLRYPPDPRTGVVAEHALRLFQSVQRRLEAANARGRRNAFKYEQNRIKACRKMGIEPTLEMIDE